METDTDQTWFYLKKVINQDGTPADPPLSEEGLKAGRACR